MAFQMVQPQPMPFIRVSLNLYRFTKKCEEKKSREENDITQFTETFLDNSKR